MIVKESLLGIMIYQLNFGMFKIIILLTRFLVKRYLEIIF